MYLSHSSVWKGIKFHNLDFCMNSTLEKNEVPINLVDLLEDLIRCMGRMM